MQRTLETAREDIKENMWHHTAKHNWLNITCLPTLTKMQMAPGGHHSVSPFIVPWDTESSRAVNTASYVQQ